MPSTSSKKLPPKPGQLVSTEQIYQDSSLLAFIIDGEVVQTFLCDRRMSAILLSNPTIIEIDGENNFLEGPHIGWKYDGSKFIGPELN
jgi:hypothetical protein